MIRRAKSLEGSALQARDGEIGKVKDVYFDDAQWHVRYVVVDTGSWLTGRTVLIATSALKGDWDRGMLSADLTKEQVRNSPGIDTAKPVSRQQEEQLHQYYAWPYYWAGPFATTGFVAPVDPAAASSAAAMRAGLHADQRGPAGEPASPGAAADARQAATTARRERGDSHLRSASEVRGYDIRAQDGSIGHVEDFVLDDSSWAVRHLLVDTVNWWPGRKVLVSLAHLREISWAERSVFVTLSREEIKSGPEFDPTQPLTTDYVDRLEAHHRRPGGTGMGQLPPR